jgi:putative ABC transport system substrate-binding protein
LRRRDFIKAFAGSAGALLPLAARAQRIALPVIGFLNSGSPEAYRHLVTGFHQGLKEMGYVEGENVTIEYRWANGHYDQLNEMLSDLVRRRVNVIVAATTPAALAEHHGYQPSKFRIGAKTIGTPARSRAGGNDYCFAC